MAGRIEYKFLVPNSRLDDLRADLLPYVARDSMGGAEGSGAYTVRSIYCDTPRMQSYDAKADGLKVRSKFRIRGYGRPTPDSVVYLEIKKKYADFIEKHRAPLLHSDLESFLAAPDIDRHIIQSSGTSRERCDAERFVYHYCRYGLLPSALVVYDREAFLGRFDPTLRMTFDKALRRTVFPALETLYDEHALECMMPGTFTFEVKFFRSALPAFVRSIITRHGLHRSSLSKYMICLDGGQTMATSTHARRGLFLGASRSL